jgi:DNA replication protein DnaC
MLDQIKNLSYQMRLFGIHESCERRAAEAVAGALHPLEFLRLVLEEELLSRKDRASKMLVTRARFRFSADLEDWDTSFDRGVTRQKMKELALLSFFHNRENPLILGKTGEGKTHLAIALGKRLCREGYKTLFLSTNFLFEEIDAARASGKYLPYLKALIKADALILDDFGVRSYTHAEATSLMDLLEERYQKGVVLLTSQVNPEGWKKLFEDPVIAEAIVDRLVHPSQKILLNGGTTYRGRLGKNKTKGGNEKDA